MGNLGGAQPQTQTGFLAGAAAQGAQTAQAPSLVTAPTTATTQAAAARI